MSIHDVGTNDNRTNSSPNIHDTLTERPADGTQGFTQKVDTNTGAFVSTQDGTLLVNDGETDIIAIGRQSDGTYGIKAVVEGADVSTATADQVTFDSADLTFQIIKVITDVRVRAPGAPLLTVTLTTGLKTAPASLGYLSTYLYGAGQPTETALMGTAGYALNAEYIVYGQLAGDDGYVTITYPANGTGSTIEFTATIILYDYELPTQ